MCVGGVYNEEYISYSRLQTCVSRICDSMKANLNFVDVRGFKWDLRKPVPSAAHYTWYYAYR